MGVTYDSTEDILYVRLQDAAAVHHSVAIDDLRIIDYTDDNAVVGIEFIGASGGVDVRDIPFARRVEQMIRDEGFAFPVFA